MFDRTVHFSAKSWHWSLVHGVYGKKAWGRACAYYWVKIPASIIVWVVLRIIWLVLKLFQLAIIIGFWFCGYQYKGKFFVEDFEDTSHYGYKELPNGGKALIVPWEIITPLTIAGILGYLIFVNPKLGKDTLIFSSYLALGATVAVAVSYSIVRVFRSSTCKRVRVAIGRKWDKICPYIQVDD